MNVGVSCSLFDLGKPVPAKKRHCSLSVSVCIARLINTKSIFRISVIYRYLFNLKLSYSHKHVEYLPALKHVELFLGCNGHFIIFQVPKLLNLLRSSSCFLQLKPTLW